MRFKTWLSCVVGDKRTDSWFAWLPVFVGNEVRWLEKVKVEYELKEVPAFLPPCLPSPKWVKIRFIDDIA